MYPFFRLITVSARASMASELRFDSVSRCTFYAHPWDIDMFMEMNNGRHLTLYDLGRFDLAIKCGLTKVLKRKRWGLVVAGASLRFRKRIRMFQKITMETQLVGMDEKWFYFHQAMSVKGQPCSSAILRTAVTEAGKALPTATVAKEMGLEGTSLELESWVKAWADADSERPWPPVFAD